MRIQNKQLGFLVVLGLPHILTLIIFLTNVITNKLVLRLRCHFAVYSGNFSILERFEIKRVGAWFGQPYFLIFCSKLSKQKDMK